MSALTDWKRFSTLPAGRLAAVGDRAVARYVRDELWPFARAARRRLERAGLAPSAVRGLADLAPVRPVRPAELARAQREPDERDDHLLIPDTDALRRSAGLGRRWAARLGGPRVAKLLAHAYTTLFEIEAEDGLRLAWTPHDVEIAGESGARALAILGLARRRDRTLALVDEPHDTAALALHHGAIQAGARVEVTRPDTGPARAERLRPTALIGSPTALARLLADGPELPALERVVIAGLADGPDDRRALAERAAERAGAPVELARLWAPAWARLAFAGPIEPGHEVALHVHPDLGAFELDPEATEATPAGANLVYTAACGHGTAVLRLATGLRASRIEAPAPGSRVGFPLLTFDSAPTSH